MKIHLLIAPLLTGALLTAITINSRPTRACCPVGDQKSQILNADQTVIIIWDAANKTQHFIRKASFRADADNFGFIIPSPTQPELAESDDSAFRHLGDLTAPKIQYETVKTKHPPKSADGAKDAPKDKDYVKVLEKKRVAGFDATVLETNSTTALVGWLKDNGYVFSPAVEAWAKPYVDAGWKLTALKVAKDANNRFSSRVSADALRMSFKTDRPLFPYREPDSHSATKVLGDQSRLLRIYFIADARYEGELTKEQPWTTKVAWAGPIQQSDRKGLMGSLKLADKAAPTDWWLTEFEHYWPHRTAEADVYFAKAADQSEVRRPPIIITNYVYDPDAPNDQPGGESESWLTKNRSLALVGLLVLISVAILFAIRSRA